MFLYVGVWKACRSLIWWNENTCFLCAVLLAGQFAGLLKIVRIFPHPMAESWWHVSLVMICATVYLCEVLLHLLVWLVLQDVQVLYLLVCLVLQDVQVLHLLVCMYICMVLQDIDVNSPCCLVWSLVQLLLMAFVVTFPVGGRVGTTILRIFGGRGNMWRWAGCMTSVWTVCQLWWERVSELVSKVQIHLSPSDLWRITADLEKRLAVWPMKWKIIWVVDPADVLKV